MLSVMLCAHLLTPMQPDGSHIDTADIPSLKVEVEQVDFTPPRHQSDLPTFSAAQSQVGFQGGDSSASA